VPNVAIAVGVEEAGVEVAAGVDVAACVEVAAVEESSGVGVGVLVAGTGVLATEEQAVVEIVLLSSVTAPFCASARPSRLAPVSRLIDVRARMLPTKSLLVPRVAELPTRHQTSHGSPPETDASDDMFSAETALNTQTPDPARVRFPVSRKLPAEQ
jgi:hypothetical protein